MKKTYLSIAAVLVAGIASVLWYAERPSVTITYGAPALSTPSTSVDARGNLVTGAEQPGTASAQPATTSNPPVPTEGGREANPACDSVRITIESASYVPCVDGTVTVLAAMQTATADGLIFSGREYPGLGFFVETLNGKHASDGYYWFLYINDKSSAEGASQTLIRPGDEVEWRYKQSY